MFCPKFLFNIFLSDFSKLSYLHIYDSHYAFTFHLTITHLTWRKNFFLPLPNLLRSSWSPVFSKGVIHSFKKDVTVIFAPSSYVTVCFLFSDMITPPPPMSPRKKYNNMQKVLKLKKYGCDVTICAYPFPLMSPIVTISDTPSPGDVLFEWPLTTSNAAV